MDDIGSSGSTIKLHVVEKGSDFVQLESFEWIIFSIRFPNDQYDVSRDKLPGT